MFLVTEEIQIRKCNILLILNHSWLNVPLLYVFSSLLDMLPISSLFISFAYLAACDLRFFFSFLIFSNVGICLFDAGFV